MMTYQEIKELLHESVRIETNQFVNSHGKKPRGTGNWLFGIGPKEKWENSNDGRLMFGRNIFHVTANYSEAVKQAKNYAVKMGEMVIYVLP